MGHIKKEFRKMNLKRWEDVLQSTFDGNIPEHCEWTSIIEINKIISSLSGEDLNHMLYPDGGGLDILGCKISDLYRNSIEIDTGLPLICKPKVLVFDCISGSPEWSYFWLELNEIEPSGFCSSSFFEELYEINPNVFEAYSEYPTYEESRRITRVLKGTLLIIPKTCFYNSLPETYDGRHSRCTHLIFKQNMMNLKGSKRYQQFLLELKE